MNDNKSNWGIKLVLVNTELSWTFMILVLILIAILFYILSVLRVVRNKLS